MQGVLRILSDRDDRMGAKIKTQKISLDQNLTPQKSNAEFPSVQKFPESIVKWYNYYESKLAKITYLNQAIKKEYLLKFS